MLIVVPQFGHSGVPSAVQLGRPVAPHAGHWNWPPTFPAGLLPLLIGCCPPVFVAAIPAPQYGQIGMPTAPHKGQTNRAEVGSLPKRCITAPQDAQRGSPVAPHLGHWTKVRDWVPSGGAAAGAAGCGGSCRAGAAIEPRSCPPLGTFKAGTCGERKACSVGMGWFPKIVLVSPVW